MTEDVVTPLDFVSCRTFLFFTGCDVIYDLLQYTHTGKCYLFVNINILAVYCKYFNLIGLLYLISIRRKIASSKFSSSPLAVHKRNAIKIVFVFSFHKN